MIEPSLVFFVMMMHLAQKIQVAVSCCTLFAMYLVEVVVLMYTCLATFLNNKLC